MRHPAGPIFGLVTALFMQALAGGLPLHAHADHSAQVTHVENAHGGHDALVIQGAERQKANPPVVPQAQDRFRLGSPADEAPSNGAETQPRVPVAHAAVAQPPPRAPPTFL